MASTPRLLIFGIDGLAPRLLSAASAAGLTPRLDEFGRAAATAPLRCAWPPHTATGWPTLFHGRLPGEHGLIQFWDCQDPSYRLRVVSREEAGVACLWDELAAAGWSLGLLNLPMSHPPSDHPGYQITWPLVPTLRYIRPAELGAELLEVAGHVQPDIACMYDGSSDYPSRAAGFVRGRTRAVLHLLANRPVDAVAVVYSELDRVCHHYWHGIDASAHRPLDASPGDASVIPRILHELDSAFGEIIDALPPETVVLVVSDHGFGPGRRGVRLHRLLADGGFCSLRGGGQAPASGNLPDRQLEIIGRLPELDWSRTTAYMPAPGSFGVNLNLIGRQESGTVRPEERDSVRERLRRFLLAQRDSDSGERLFSAVVEGERAYAGVFAERAPDLLLVPRDPTLMLLCDLDGPTIDGPGQNGLHRMEGVWMLRAPGIAPGAAAGAMAAEAVAGHLLDVLAVEGDGVPRRARRPADEAVVAAGLPPGAWSEAGDREPLRLDADGEPAGEPAHLAAPVPLSGADIRQRLREMGYL